MNRLARESSPYLRQHAENPVDWYPWGEEAFARARDEDKPVLLSVGYSACHWCHVMAHESFENPETAELMNRLFVNIKVDREERPDVDEIYMQAIVALTGSGGWPMTVFLSPDARPFFGGTYFPSHAAHGRPSFTEVLKAVDRAWKEQRGELIDQADNLHEVVRSRTAIRPPRSEMEITFSTEVVRAAEHELVRSADREWGGFGAAPKFPMASTLELGLRAWLHSGSEVTRDVVFTTLDAMASGGIYDHLGGGFARYSVDARWLVPHFEKMLYDNALIPLPYLHAFQVTGEVRFGQVVEETIGYVLRELRAPGGGICSAEDADSEGVEGKYYFWEPEEITAALAAAGASDCLQAALRWYGVGSGRSVLHRPVRGDLLRPPEIERARQALLAARQSRVRPGLDDKVVTEWNAMFVATLAEAGAALHRPDWITAAETIADFLVATLRREDGRWLRCWQLEGGARHLAYATDYAHLVDAFCRLGEASGHAQWYAEAQACANGLLELFWDDGCLFLTGTDAEQLLVRTQADPAAAVALLRLGALTGKDRYTQAAHADLRHRHTHLDPVGLAAVDSVTTGITEIVIVGDREDLVAEVQRRYLPNAVVAWGEPWPTPLWEGRDREGAYVCRDYACLRPATTVEELAGLLSR